MNIRIRDKFTRPEITIEASAVKTTCAVVGNQGESFKTVGNTEVEAPMDSAIVRLVLICLSLCIRSHSQFTGYYEICRPRVRPQRRPLKLVHISNGLRMVEGAGPLQVGDVFRSEASLTNTDATLLGSRITCIMKTSPSSKSFRLHLPQPLQRLRGCIQDHRGV